MKDMVLYDPNKSNRNALMTFSVESLNDKRRLYNAVTTPDKSLSDCINMEINVQDVYIEMVDLTDSRTKEPTTQARTILFDTDGVSYACVSSGVYNSLVRAFEIFGMPTWEDGLNFKVVQITRGENKILSLQLV